MKVICIKLTSGEEIIAKLVEAGLVSSNSQFDTAGPWVAKGSVTVKTVRGITIQPVGPNQVGIGFVPWSVGNVDAEITLDLSTSVVAVYPPSSDLEKGYLEQTSGLDLSSGNRPGIKL